MIKKDKERIELIQNWIDTDMVKATITYNNWQHDKGSFAYGYIMALLAVLHILKDEDV